jgi:hypothetical protein
MNMYESFGGLTKNLGSWEGLGSSGHYQPLGQQQPPQDPFAQITGLVQGLSTTGLNVYRTSQGLAPIPDRATAEAQARAAEAQAQAAASQSGEKSSAGLIFGLILVVVVVIALVVVMGKKGD